MRWIDAFRMTRLAVVVSLVPFVRSCDDAIGLSETTGFPIPYAVHINHQYQFDSVDWAALCANAVFFVVLAIVVSRRFPQILDRVAGIRALLVVAAFAAICCVFNAFIFVALMFAAMPIYFVLTGFNSWIVIDVMSRALFVAVFAGAVIVMSAKGKNARSGDNVP